MSRRDKVRKLRTLGEVLAMAIRTGEHLSPEFQGRYQNAKSFEDLLKLQHYMRDRRFDQGFIEEFLGEIDTLIADEINMISLVADQERRALRLEAEIAIVRAHADIDRKYHETMHRMEADIKAVFAKAAKNMDEYDSVLVPQAEKIARAAKADLRTELDIIMRRERDELAQSTHCYTDSIRDVATRLRFS